MSLNGTVLFLHPVATSEKEVGVLRQEDVKILKKNQKHKVRALKINQTKCV